MSIDLGDRHHATRDQPSSLPEGFENGAHAVQFYVDDAILTRDLATVVGAALGEGRSSVVIATPEHRAQLEHRLAERGLKLADPARAGRYVPLDSAETLVRFMVDGQPDATRFDGYLGGIVDRARGAATSEPPDVVIFGEMVARLWADGRPDAALHLERLWNALIQTHPSRLWCAYPMALFRRSGDDAAIARICAEHARVIPAESYTALASEDERLRAIILLQQKAQLLEAEIEARVRVEAELRRTLATRDAFLAAAAHELKTPLTSLRGFAQLLLRKARRIPGMSIDQCETALHAIELQTVSLERIVSQLLDAVEIEAGHLRIEPSPGDLVALTRSTLARFSGSTAHRIVFNAPERLEALVDPLRFEQVVANLLANAIKYSPAGGAIRVELDRDDRGIQLSVTDSGLGLPADRREKVFERFHQAHADSHRSGLGLGLFVTREIVELHGGSIRAEQPDHPGTRFVVTLPLAPAGAASEPAFEEERR